MKCTIKELYDFLKKEKINLLNNNINIFTRFGYIKMEACEITKYNSEQIEIKLEDNYNIIGSPEHLLFKDNNWKKINELKINDKILTNFGYKKIIEKNKLNNKSDLYDIQVHDIKEFYANDIVSHNSTIIDVLKFGLYGRVNNKKLKDIPNRLNKNCEVEIELKSNNRNVVIKRGLEPNYFKIDAEGFEQLDEQAGKLNVQDKLENEIFGIPFYVFNNIISLSVNDFKSFIKMTPNDKREIIDKIIGLSIINRMYEALKIDIKQIVETDNNMLIKSDVLNTQLKRTTKQLEELSKKLIETSNEKQDEINIKIEALNKLKLKFKEKFDEQNKILSNFVNRIDENKHLLQEAKYQSKDISNKIKLYDNTKCPECGSDLHTEWHEERLSSYIEEKERWQEAINKLQQTINKEVTDSKQIEFNKQELKNKLNKIDNNNAVLIDQLNKIQDKSYIDNQTTSMKNLIDDTQIQIESLKTEKVKIENKLQFYKIIEEALSDRGIKQLAMRTILPTINSQIYQLLKELNLDFKLSFAEDWSSTITHLGQEINSTTLSTGENKKLDMAVILAMIRLMKLKFPGLNILFLDEVISSLDSDSVVHVLKLLAKTSEDLSLHIFIINHAPVDDSQFDYKIDIQKTSGFSNIIIDKQK